MQLQTTKRPVAERRQVVERAGDQLLAGAALAGDERGGGVAGQALDEGEELGHDVGPTHHALEDRRGDEEAAAAGRQTRHVAKRRARRAGGVPGSGGCFERKFVGQHAVVLVAVQAGPAVPT